MKDDYYLERVVNCPRCNKPVKYGDMIWKDGINMCPDCYTHFMRSYYNIDVTNIHTSK